MNKSVVNLPVPCLNFHLWEPCNMRCKFCFATFQDVKQRILPKGHLPRQQSIELMHEICSTNIQKITFAGGEPTLCPWLYDLIAIAKSYNKTTMIVTNGSRINKDWIKKYQNELDWITVSIDSLDSNMNFNSGRAINGRHPISRNMYLQICQSIKKSKIRLKINTIVSQLNKTENFSCFINKVKPERWKILQALHIIGQNDSCIEQFIIPNHEFQDYINRQKINQNVSMVIESNNDMIGSYLMIDPAGRFYQNKNSRYEYSIPILDVGIVAAAKSIEIDVQKFVARGGIYNW